MTPCLFVDRRGRRCDRVAKDGGVFCLLHSAPATSRSPVPEISEGEPGAEPIRLPAWQRFLRWTAAAVLLALFLLQMYLVGRELLK